MKKILILVFVTASFAFASVKQAKPSPAIARGAQVYQKVCLACHQADGGGIQRMNPPLIKTEYVLGDKKRLINIVLNGLTSGVEIDGDTYSNPMPSQAGLTDQQIADVLSYVRNSFGNKASIVTPAEVKVQRAKMPKTPVAGQ
jgi:mono/diheme cytochrome c family protein